MSRTTSATPKTGRVRRTFRGSGSLTVPDGVYRVTGLLVGGGGGGGGAMFISGAAYNGTGGGGGGGFPLDIDVPVVPGDVLAVLIGAGGTAGPAASGVTNANGGPGGDSTLLLNGLPVLVASGGGYGGGVRVTSDGGGGWTGQSEGGSDAYGRGGQITDTVNRAGGGGAGYTGGVTVVVYAPRHRAGRGAYSNQGDDKFPTTNGVKQWNTSTVDGAKVESMLVQPKRFHLLGQGGWFSAANVASPARAANTGAGGDAGNFATTSATYAPVPGAAGGSGVAFIEWEITS